MSGFTGGAEFAVTLQPLLHRPTFSSLPEKVGKKRRWKRIGLYRGATESPRRRTLRPAHENLSAKLHYSAACLVTTLPSVAVAAQGDGKTRCCGNGRPSTYTPMVQNRNWPSIPKMSRNGIDSVCPQMRVVHSSEPKAIGKMAILRPNRAFRPRSGQRIARVSAQYKNRIANQRSVCNSERTSNGTDETCRLRRDEGLREAPRAQALRRAIGLAERMQSEASLGACEDEALLFAYFFWQDRKSRPPEARLRPCHIKGNSGEYRKRGPM